MRSQPTAPQGKPGVSLAVLPRLALLIIASLVLIHGAQAGDDVTRTQLTREYLGGLTTLGQPSEDTGSVRTPALYAPPPPPSMLDPMADSSSLPEPGHSARGDSIAQPEESIGEREAGDERTQQGDDDLEPFGLDVFRPGSGSFQVVDEVPVPADYRVGPGDQLVVNLWGRVDRTYELTVDREGKVFLPEAGTVVVWDIGLAEATERIRAQLAKVYSGFEINVMMGRVRSIRVYVYGEAEQPGSYAVSALSTLMNVLHQAGGPTERGSLRRIRVLRGGTLHATVDLYDMLLAGEGGAPDLALRAQDAIFIPVVGPRVAVTGEVKRPAIYELKGGETVEDVITLAGGATPYAYRHRVAIDRVVDGDRRIVLDLDLADSGEAATPVSDGDRVSLVATDEEREEVVHLSGWTKYAGVYGYRPGMRVSDLLRDGEVLREESYLPRAVIRRPLPDGTHRLIPVDLSAALGNDLRRGARPFDEGFLAGDAVHLGTPERTDPPAYGTPSGMAANPLLEPRDVLHVYSAREMGWQHHVTIQGHVKSPGRYELARAMKLSDLIFEAGGLLPGADLERAELVRLEEDGTSQTFAVDLKALLVACDPDEDLKLEKDDAVFVRQVPDRLEPEKVLIEGEVRFPGHYSLTRRGEPLSSVLARAGGLTDDAFPGGAVFTRTAINEHIERQNVLPVFMSFRADSVTGIPMGIAPWLTELKPELLPTSRMAIDLPRLLETGGKRGDVPLQDGDRLLVPRRPSGVPVIGHVAAAGTVQYVSGRSAGYYLDRAGGITESGDKGGLRVVRANGEVVQCGRGERIEIGDSIVVPPRTRPPRDWSWLKSTVGMIGGATAAAVILNQLD